MGVGSGKSSPSSRGGRGGIKEAFALASSKVFKGAGGGRDTARDTTVARGVTTPITPQPASSIAPAGHFELNCGFLNFELLILT